MTTKPFTRRVALPSVAALSAAAWLSACGGPAPRTALAIEDAHWTARGTLVVTTECADDVEVEVGADHGGSDLMEVTLWGRPRVGRCRPSLEVPLDPGVRATRPSQVVDGTTSMVVDIA